MIERYARREMKAIWTDEGMYERWLSVELAVCEAWCTYGLIPKTDMEKLRKAHHDPVLMEVEFEKTKHDVNSFIRSITPTLGAEGRWVHYGLTSNDVKDTALGLQLRDSTKILLEGVDLLINVLAQKAVAYKDTMIMGRSHGIHAEPTTFGLKLALWWDEMRRNRRRLVEAGADVSVGKISGAVGTHATVPLEVEIEACASLRLTPAPLSNQVVQRDRHAYFVTTIGVIAASLEKFATEIRHLQRTEIHEVEEPFGEGQTGSSAMPHKRNPELSERVCGLARLVRGHAVTALENVALWHERDISHSSAERVILPDTCLALDYIIDLFAGVLSGLKVFPEKMKENIELTKGLIFSERVMLALVDKGKSREEAYGIAQILSRRVSEERADFRDLVRNEATVKELLLPEELDVLFDYGYYVRHVDHMMGQIGLIQQGKNNGNS